MFQILYSVACMCIVTEDCICVYNASVRKRAASSDETETNRVHSLSCPEAFPFCMYDAVARIKVSWNSRYRLGCP